MQAETGTVEEVKTDWIIGTSNMSAQLTVTLTDFLSSKLYQINFQRDEKLKVTVDNKVYFILKYNSSFPYENTKADKKIMESLQTQAAVVGGIASLGASSSPATTEVI